MADASNRPDENLPGANGRTFFLANRRVIPDRRVVRNGSHETRLSPRAFSLLQALCRAPEKTQDRQELVTAVWGDAAVGDEVLFKAVSELRQAFGDDAKKGRVIETIPKRGYRLAVKPRVGGMGHQAVACALVATISAVIWILWPTIDEAESAAVAKAHYVLSRNDHEAGERAIQWLNEAVAEHPQSAQLHALLGKVMIKFTAEWETAREQVDRALALDQSNVLALVTRARIALHRERNWALAKTYVDRAVGSAPDNPMVLVARSEWLVSVGEFDLAVIAAARAEKLDPISAAVKGNLAYVHYLAGEYRLALAAAKRSLDLQPADRYARRWQLESLWALGDTANARTVGDKVLRDAQLAQPALDSLAEESDSDYINAWLRLWLEAGPGGSVHDAAILARLGEHDDAIQVLQQSLVDHSSSLAMIASEPGLAALSQRETYQTILREIKHPLAR